MESQKSLVMPISIAVLISAIVFGMGGYYLGTGQFVDDTDSAAGVLATPAVKTTTTATATATPATLKTFSSAALKFSFQYPSTWTLKDNTQGVTKETSPEQTIDLTGPQGIPTVTVWINPAGHGVPIPEAQYTIEYKNGKVVFGDRQVNVTKPSDELQAQKGNIQFTGELNGNKFYIMATKVSDSATEDLLKEIVSTYKAL